MFEIIFGVIWLSITGLVTLGFYSGTASSITVNGQLVSQEEFNLMLWPKIFLGIFWVIGIIMIIVGLRKIIKNAQTEKFGEVCYGRIIDIMRTGTLVNNVPELKAVVQVFIESEGRLDTIEEVIGLATNRKYNIGDYIEGKYYNGDINIDSYIPETVMPLHIQEKLRNIKINTSEDEIIVDGVKYVRKDSIDLR